MKWWAMYLFLAPESPKTYDVTIQRYRISHTKIKVSKMHIFAEYWFKILCEISKVFFGNSHKSLNPYTTKYAFYKVWKK